MLNDIREAARRAEEFALNPPTYHIEMDKPLNLSDGEKIEWQVPGGAKITLTVKEPKYKRQTWVQSPPEEETKRFWGQEYTLDPNPPETPSPRLEVEYDEQGTQPGLDELERRALPEMLAMSHNAMRFYMELHRHKGSILYDDEDEMMAGIDRNRDDLKRAKERGDKEEILAEGIGLANWACILVYNLATFELEEIQDYQPTLERLKREGIA